MRGKWAVGSARTALPWPHGPFGLGFCCEGLPCASPTGRLPGLDPPHVTNPRLQICPLCPGGQRGPVLGTPGSLDWLVQLREAHWVGLGKTSEDRISVGFNLSLSWFPACF